MWRLNKIRLLLWCMCIIISIAPAGIAFGNNGATSDGYTYTYDPSGKLIELGHPNGDIYEYVYDNNGNLVNKIKNTYTNLSTSWKSLSGSWSSISNGKKGEAEQYYNGFYINGRSGSDFHYEASIKLLTPSAGALVFRANDSATTGYVVNIDSVGFVRLWDIGAGKVIKDYYTPIKLNEVYHLKVITNGSNIKVYLNNSTAPVIDIEDSNYTSGYFGLNVYNGKVTFHNVYTRESYSNLLGKWNVVSGNWATVLDEKQGEASKHTDTFYLNSQLGKDFVYEGSVKLLTPSAGALVFRANANATAGYAVNIDSLGQVVRLWDIGTGKIIKDYYTPINLNESHHLKVVTNGNNIKVYLNNSTSPVIDVQDSTYASGRFGLNVHYGKAAFKNINVSESFSNLLGKWTAVRGGWSILPEGKQGEAIKLTNSYYLNSHLGKDFVYEGSIKLVTPSAGALVFRANASATAGYVVNIDSLGQVVRLWDIGTGKGIVNYYTPIKLDETYQLKVITNGSNIKVHLNGSASPIIDVDDSSYASGQFGVNTYNGKAIFNDVIVKKLISKTIH
ncbi:DUF1080 domain-containing protein [Paenibacillus sp. GSMTC-2017]|uniref:family 16 glycoside hydrolase n=1 Tax=Paenibacillus sp. GSMTC-2017 TaxID=2794350 RepID=UPI0018D84D24|nr:family 16 glycoside hydrolase [Paenibacillus sp. GSMTC-2017]MBH5317203.1 DUF1080 domain-containing protein [Paenibacillus sp. GSMTC-2017]